MQFNAVSADAQKSGGFLSKCNCNSKLNWDPFLEHLTKLAKTQHDLPWNEKRYLKQIKCLLRQCNLLEFGNVKTVFADNEDKPENWF